jgi:SpoVK/Ycf46/Vps4 family AAA+-type ATPase
VDVIDEAFLRPGRIDRIIFVGPPDEVGRKEIFERKLERIEEERERKKEKEQEIKKDKGVEEEKEGKKEEGKSVEIEENEKNRLNEKAIEKESNLESKKIKPSKKTPISSDVDVDELVNLVCVCVCLINILCLAVSHICVYVFYVLDLPNTCFKILEK